MSNFASQWVCVCSRNNVFKCRIGWDPSYLALRRVKHLQLASKAVNGHKAEMYNSIRSLFQKLEHLYQILKWSWWCAQVNMKVVSFKSCQEATPIDYFTGGSEEDYHSFTGHLVLLGHCRLQKAWAAFDKLILGGLLRSKWHLQGRLTHQGWPLIFWEVGSPDQRVNHWML